MAIPAPRDPKVTRDCLEAWFRSKVAEDARITEIEIPKHGFSNETLFFTASWSEGGASRVEQLVARVQPDGHELFFDTDVMIQWRMMTAIKASEDVPVPELRWSEAGTNWLGAPFFIMTRIDARVPPDLPSYHSEGWVADLPLEERALLWNNGVDALAKIHGLDWEQGFRHLDDPRRGNPGLDQYLRWVRDWYAWATNGRAQPTGDIALQYVLDNQPANADVGVTWGDARIGNLMYADDLSVAAVIDWEMAALGPGEMDLGWWLFMDRLYSEGLGVSRLDGLPSREETVARYEDQRGQPVQNLKYYEIMAGLRMAIVVIRSTDKNVEYGVLPPDTTLATHNPATTILAELLDLAPVQVSDGLAAATGAATVSATETNGEG
jgi:aminoglycoside phosphotransferase (APT) family kinase protein